MRLLYSSLRPDYVKEFHSFKTGDGYVCRYVYSYRPYMMAPGDGCGAGGLSELYRLNGSGLGSYYNIDDLEEIVPCIEECEAGLVTDGHERGPTRRVFVDGVEIKSS